MLILQSDIGVPVYTSKEPPSSNYSHSAVLYKYLHPVMSEALRRGLRLLLEYSTSDWTAGGANYAVAAFIDNVSPYDRQQVIYIFDKMHVKVNTQESRVKNVIHRDCRR